tara:strand:+ start:259 stop:447 length:189 start_codon:yes stop_codon:yes gene_type:complete
MKYKEQILNHLELATDQIEKLLNDVQNDATNKVEHTKRCENILTKLEHCSNLVDLEGGTGEI